MSSAAAVPRPRLPAEPPARPAAGARWRVVAVDGARVRLLEVGRGEPLLFLHGWGLSPAAYADGLTRLAAGGVRVLAPGLPGFGGSDRLPFAGVDLPSYARRVGRLLDVLGHGSPVQVAGHSFGGGVALQLARDRPEQVRALTLLNPVGGASGRGGTGVWLGHALAAAAELAPGAAARSAPAVLRDFLPHLARPATLALTARLALSAALAPTAAALVAAGLPVRVVWSDRDRLVARGALARVAGLSSQVVPGSHGWLLDDPAAFAALLGEVLEVSAAAPVRASGRITP